ncbi:MAG: hypothetical protein ACYTGN_13720 [Planctomycetota bacterium]
MSRDAITLGAYGKLPLSREFLTFSCDGKFARGLTDFVHEAARSMADMPQRDDAVRMYAPLARGAVYAAASIWPSSDAGGKRPFPFCMFTIRKPDALPPGHPGFCTAFAPMHAAHEDAYLAFRGMANAGDFESYLRAADGTPGPGADGERDFRRAALGIETETFIRKLYGDEDRRFAVLLWRLAQLARADAELSQGITGLRLPLVKGLPLETQADAWLGLLKEAGGLGPRPNMLLGDFGPGDTASMVLLLRPVHPRDFEIVAERPVRNLFDLSAHKELADMAGFDDFAEKVRVRVAETHTTLEDLPSILKDI